MARYDAGWDRPVRGGRYDRPFRPPQPAPRGYDAGWGGTREGRDWPGEWEFEGGPEEGFRSGIYGPARYGLGPYHERLRQRKRPDAELQEEVAEALFYDTWVDAERITVEVKGGIVTLKGELPSYDEVRYATDDAWDVDGVLGVRSELTVEEG